MDFVTISKLLSGIFYAIPDYQRDYEWTNAQNSTLIEDVFTVMDGAEKDNHFFGAIVTIPYEQPNGTNTSITFKEFDIAESQIKHIVDGQQRLTSFSILMVVLKDLLSADPTINTTFKENYTHILKSLLTGQSFDKDGNPAPIIVLNGNTGNYFNSDLLKIRQDSCNKALKGVKRIKAAYALFLDEINKKRDEAIKDHKFANNGEFYKKLIDTIKDKITFVEIACNESSNAFQVFDSLNGKGLDLTAADRIKNIFMSWAPAGKGVQKWDALVSEVGEDYLSNFFISLFFYSDLKRISKNKLPEVFRKTYQEQAKDDFNAFFTNLKNDGALYGSLRKSKTDNSAINEYLMDFNSLGLDQVYVLIYAVAKKNGTDSISTDEYSQFVSSLQSLIVRMQVCDKSMNKLDSIFSKCIEEMKNTNTSISDITQILHNNMKALANDSQFLESFISFAPSENKIGEFYLRHIENYMRNKKGNRNKVERGLTVEHIIPQTLDDLSDWYGANVSIPEEIANDFKDSVVENIGNKMLLFGDDNSAANNNNYAIKLAVYKNGNRGADGKNPVATFQMAKELVAKFKQVFNHDEVKKRAKSLAKIAVEIWK